MFTNFNEFVKTYKAKDQHIQIWFSTIENHLAMLANVRDILLQMKT